MIEPVPASPALRLSRLNDPHVLRSAVACLAGALLLLGSATANAAAPAKAAKTTAPVTPALEKISLDGLAFRGIGPAVTGGRVIDIEVNPRDHSEYYVASGHGSLWKTTNAGVTFTPVFDEQSSFSIGAVTLAPSDPNLVWVGTGENNAQSNVVPGDGVYKSEDGGKSWTNMGLKESQQIGEIVVHPTQPNIVWVAAYGPQRTSGGDRGVFKTTDGGKTWTNVLHPSDNTGCWELHMDPRDPNVLYTVAHQRQRGPSATVSGGDESAIYKTIDGGTTWKRLEGGLPQKKVGRIGMDLSPADPSLLYAIVDAKEKQDKGTYVSHDAGASWTRAGDYVTTYPFYCQKVFCDPKNTDRVYAMDMFNQVSIDGGRSWSRLGEDKKHVDNHALWIDPSDPRHMLSGCDGGLYETFDRAASWAFKPNLPIAEVYKVTADNAKPFYNVYIGTQDNNSLGGPTRTMRSNGIVNSDWTFTEAGDGFQSQVDWADPNIVYSQAQYGALVRFDRKTGERLYLRGYEDTDHPAYRFDWDTPLLVSPHDHTRLYQGANMVLRSNDRGESWREISPDLTRGVPKDMGRVMGRSWSIDEMITKADAAHLTALAESPLDEKRLYAGSGDGLLHFTRDGGRTWQLAELPGLPQRAAIHQITASPSDVNVAYAACSNFLSGDYAPYLYKTTDGGARWALINANLPARGTTWSIAVDDVDPDLIFVGTMTGVFVSNTPKIEWVKLKNGLPASVEVLDMTIQRETHDLIVSTFGRGVFVLDDYTPLRHLNGAALDAPQALFPIPDAAMFLESDPLGFPGVGFQGASYFSAPNPTVGAAITYFIKDDYKSLKKQRNAEEKKLQDAGADVPYPTYERLKQEAAQEDPYLLFVISDASGRAVRELKQPVKAGVHRIYWDFRTSPVVPIALEPRSGAAPWDSPDQGYMLPPGTYTVAMYRYQDRKLTALGTPQSVKCEPLRLATLPPADATALAQFNVKVAALARAIAAADAHRSQLSDMLPALAAATLSVPPADESALAELAAIKASLRDLDEALNGDEVRTRFEGQARMSLKGRTDLITGSLWATTSGPTGTYQRAYDEAHAAFGKALADLRAVHERIASYQKMLEQRGAPYTPGRLPVWEDAK